MKNNDVIDLYNDCVWEGIHPTLVVRTMPSNNYFIMRLTKAYGISRTRDERGNITKTELKPYTMCIHTNVGGGWDTMAVLIAEEYEGNTEIREDGVREVHQKGL